MLSLKRFAGGRGPAISIEATRALSSEAAIVTGVAVTYESDGTLTLVADTATPSTTEYVYTAPLTGVGARYWIRWTNVSGFSGHWVGATMTLGTWYQLSTGRHAGFAAGAPTSGDSVWDADIAIDAAGATIVGTTRWTMTLTITP